MPKIDHDTKEKILDAAEKVFHQNGFKGTRTTTIAEYAGISRTMLHYYYSTKEDLFQAVLNKTLGAVFPHLNNLLKQNMGLEQSISHIVDTLCGLFQEKPTLPSFVVNILNESPDVAMMLATSTEDDIPHRIEDLLRIERQNNDNIDDDITGEDIMMNIYSLCATPYLAINYVKAKENRSDEQMMDFMGQRKEKIKKLMLKSLRK